MKKLIITLSLVVISSGAFAQGLITWVNNYTTLISYGPMSGPYVPIPSGQAGRYVFGLFIADVGTTDPLAFGFSGLYGTNVAAAGTCFGGVSRPVPGWAAATSKAYFIAGWDAASMGHDYDPGWLPQFLAGIDPLQGDFGYSSIGSGMAGGFLTDGSSLPPLNLFVSVDYLPGIHTGFVLTTIPEPTALALALLGAAGWFRFHRRNCLCHK